jgi:phage shock protein E
MRFLVLSVLVLVVSACQQQPSSAPSPAAAAPTPPTNQPRQVTGQEARAKVAAGATLLDVRTVDEFQELHLEGAKNIPLHELAAAMANVPKDKPVVVYCAVGARSATAAKMLASAGYEVLNLGAMGNWNQ